MRWNDTSYQKIKYAKSINSDIVVGFENGDTIQVPKDALIPFRVYDIEWEKLEFNPFEIAIPAKPKNIEISWDKLRVITDKEFAKQLASESEEQAKLIGEKIKRLRVKKNISSKDLAERAGVAAQTISRIEQGHTDVSFATLRKILAAMGYTLKDLANQEAEIEMEAPKKSLNLLLKRLSHAGVDSNLLTRKIIPIKLQTALKTQKQNEPTLLLDEVASYVSTIYGWSPDEIWTGQNLIVKPEPAELAFFKKTSNANINQIKAYSHYAYYLAKVVLKSFQRKKKPNYPGSIEEFKAEYFKKNKEIDLIPLLEFIWDMGICVLPLNDSGVFHGASWNIDGRHVVVLKQNTESHARWIFDLLHELYHVFAHLDKDNTSVIEVEEPNPFSTNDSIEELEANSFANQVIFGNKAEDYAEECVTAAKWDIRNLSKAVAQIAKKEQVREDFLSNYIAFRLSHQGENWWGSALKKQIISPNPFTVAANFLKEKIQIQNLSPIDNNLLSTALTN